jgi:hypothetical protein
MHISGQRATERANAKISVLCSMMLGVILVLEGGMGPTQFAVRCAELNRDLEAARRGGDLSRLRSILAEKTSLLKAMYGQPEQGAGPKPYAVHAADTGLR